MVWMLLAPILTSLAANLVLDAVEGLAIAPRLPGYALYHGVRIAFLVPMLVWPSARVQRAGLVLLGGYTLATMF